MSNIKAARVAAFMCFAYFLSDPFRVLNSL